MANVCFGITCIGLVSLNGSYFKRLISNVCLFDDNNIILYSQSGIEHVHVQYKTYKEKKFKKYTNN